MKENILNDAAKGGNGETNNVNNDATGNTTSTITSSIDPINRSSDAYIYGIGRIAVIAIGACVFFAYHHRSYPTLNKEKPKE